MKTIKLIVALFLTLITKSGISEGLVVLLIDPYEQNKVELQNKITGIAASSKSNILILVANNEYPLIGRNQNEVRTITKEIPTLNPGIINNALIVDTLNYLLTTEDIQENKITIYFLANAYCYKRFNQSEQLLSFLLICNNLKNRKGLTPNCKVHLLFNLRDFERLTQIQKSDILNNNHDYEIEFY